MNWPSPPWRGQGGGTSCRTVHARRHQRAVPGPRQAGRGPARVRRAYLARLEAGPGHLLRRALPPTCAVGGTTALVTPQSWLFLASYKKLRTNRFCNRSGTRCPTRAACFRDDQWRSRQRRVAGDQSVNAADGSTILPGIDVAETALQLKKQRSRSQSFMQRSLGQAANSRITDSS